MKYPVSVVVPTKNRYKYLKTLIELVISFNTNDIELVIQDNSDNNEEILEWLRNKKYTWLKYYYCSDPLTSIQNFDKAINNSTGECVSFIGDDDGIVRNIVDCAKWMVANNIEAVRSLSVEYQWPECSGNGRIIKSYQKSVIECSNPIKDLIKMFREGGALRYIPVTYAGIVKRNILDNIFRDYGTYFPGGASADIANGVALCFYVKRYVKLSIPIIITGTSKKTGGVNDRRKLMPFSEIPFISSSVVDNWEGNFPKYWLGVFVWPESAIKALRMLKQESFIQFISFEKIFARAIFRSRINPTLFYPYCSPLKLYLNIFILVIQRVFNKLGDALLKIFQRLFFRKGKAEEIRNIGSIIEAEEILKSSCVNFSSMNI